MTCSSRSAIVLAAVLWTGLVACGDDADAGDGGDSGSAIEPVDAGVPVDCSGDLPTFDEVAIRKNPDCPVCGEHPTITEYIDYVEFCSRGTVTA